MACETESERVSTPRLTLLPIPPTLSPDGSGMLTPPLQNLASIPFRWEEEPGRPSHCNAFSTVPKPSEFAMKCLELPPRLLAQSKIANLPLKTMVLDDPSSSFRMTGKDWYSSFSLERGQLAAMVLSKGSGPMDRGWFGSWKRKTFKGKKEHNGGTYVFPYFLDRHREVSDSYGSNGVTDSDDYRAEVSKFKRSDSVRSITRAKSQFWTTICDGLKQVVPWKSNKLKKDWHGKSY